MTVGIRPMRPTDAADAAALIRLAFAAQPVAVDPPPSALGITAESIAAHLRKGGGAVAEQAGKLVGAVLWEERDGGFYVSRLAVDPAARRQGIATQLLSAVEGDARRYNAKHMIVGTRLALAVNRRLFAATGFREVALHAHPGYAIPTWVELIKPLDRSA
jgi:ribosomal protein S18 acetylase RimI-like enzyme